MSEESSPSAHLMSYILSQTICYRALLEVLDLSGMSAFISVTPWHLSWSTGPVHKPADELLAPTKLGDHGGGIPLTWR